MWFWFPSWRKPHRQECLCHNAETEPSANHHERPSSRFLGNYAQDFGFAVRTLSKTPGFIAIAALSLARWAMRLLVVCPLDDLPSRLDLNLFAFHSGGSYFPGP